MMDLPNNLVGMQDVYVWLLLGSFACISIVFLVVLIRAFFAKGEPAESADRDCQTQTPTSDRIPYDLDQRAMPTGDDLETLLPVDVGPFRRLPVKRPADVHSTPIYAKYRSGDAEVFVELGICGTPGSAQMAIETAKTETDAEFPDAEASSSSGTEPSFFKTLTPLGGFMAWTRGGYYFSVHAKTGENDLDRFMRAFPF